MSLDSVGLQQPLKYSVDVKSGLVRMPMTSQLMKGDKKANRVIVEIKDGSEKVDLSGVTVTGSFIRPPDAAEIPLNGSVEDGEAIVVLDDACYAEDGYCEINVKLTIDGTTRTILALAGYVLSKGSGAYIDVGDVIPSLDDIIAQYDTMKRMTQDMQSAAEAANAAAQNANEAAEAANTEATAAQGWAEATATVVTLEAGENARVNLSTAASGAKELEFYFPRGESGVYISTEKPTDPTVMVWIDPDGEADEMPDGVTPEEIRAAVNAYLDEHPVAPGATAAQAAQIQKNKEDIAELKQNGTGSGLTDAQISALNGMFKVAAYVKADISAEYAAFKTAFGIEDSDDPVTPDKTLTGISAAYSGGDVAVGTALTALTGITVTATFSDGSTATVTDYTLSGEIAEGTNTITVSYGGMTTTITVTGVAESGGDNTGVSNDTTWTDGVPYTMTLTADTYIDANNGSVKSDEDWSSTNQLYCAGASRITFKQSDGAGVVNSRYNAFFDSDKQFISSFTMSYTGIDVPDNAAYVALSNKTEIMTVLLATPIA